MLCDNCKKRNANFHYTKVINGKMEELHLCETCAFENQEMDLNNPFSIHKLFAGLFENKQDKQEENHKDITCSNCGLTFSKFQKTGKLGCMKCYDDFAEYLKPIINGIHGHNHHRGKSPNRSSPNIKLQKEIEELMIKLDDAVKKEEFEKAAIIRDEIKEVKAKLHTCEE
ncbi:UvrB/UvrC motif-containing protein [Tissierella sp. Yu-01]|uniref:UvrB/UvrC motif-containing protein n=1 Tax=Tissierella sp. Yu-01 TaxID=3035694 RepID=UPI00240E8F8F|nr:UvrB/UvrC motif-containing protein [Tissierella sp. Yu-01]WFA07690.1 UvrB/UvrC motif-containing protein [Tissierella sp. Yu-01]